MPVPVSQYYAHLCLQQETLSHLPAASLRVSVTSLEATTKTAGLGATRIKLQAAWRMEYRNAES